MNANMNRDINGHVVSRLIRAGLLWAALVLPCAAHAQEADDSAKTVDAAEDRAASFQAVTGAVKEDVAGGPLMLGVYASVWIAVFGYVWRLNRLQSGVQANLERLERSVSSEGVR